MSSLELDLMSHDVNNDFVVSIVSHVTVIMFMSHVIIISSSWVM